MTVTPDLIRGPCRRPPWMPDQVRHDKQKIIPSHTSPLPAWHPAMPHEPLRHHAPITAYDDSDTQLRPHKATPLAWCTWGSVLFTAPTRPWCLTSWWPVATQAGEFTACAWARHDALRRVTRPRGGHRREAGRQVPLPKGLSAGKPTAARRDAVELVRPWAQWGHENPYPFHRSRSL